MSDSRSGSWLLAAIPVPNRRSLEMSAVERTEAWLVTGPIGRVAAFVTDLAAAWLRWAMTKVRRP